MKDYYKILNVSQNATEQQIKQSFRKLAKRFHPDMAKTDELVNEFINLKEAYDVLKDARLRKDYDIKYREYHTNTEDNNTTSKTESESYHNTEKKASSEHYQKNDDYDDFEDLNQSRTDYSYQDQELREKHINDLKNRKEPIYRIQRWLFLFLIGVAVMSIKNLFYTPAYIVGENWWVWLVALPLSVYLMKKLIKM